MLLGHFFAKRKSLSAKWKKSRKIVFFLHFWMIFNHFWHFQWDSKCDFKKFLNEISALFFWCFLGVKKHIVKEPNVVKSDRYHRGGPRPLSNCELCFTGWEGVGGLRIRSWLPCPLTVPMVSRGGDRPPPYCSHVPWTDQPSWT